MRFILFIFIFGSFALFSQNNKVTTDIKINLVFKAYEKQKFGFDSYQYKEWSKHYRKINLKFNPSYFVAVKSLAKNQSDKLDFIIRSKTKIDVRNLEFLVKNKALNFKQKNDSTFTLYLIGQKSDYKVNAFFNFQNEKTKIAQLDVKVFEEKTENVIIVPISNQSINEQELVKEINKIYAQANLSLNVSFKPIFKSKVFEKTTIFSNPNFEKQNYTGQMHLLRDLYFEENPKADKKAFYIFMINGFADSTINGFMLKNKALAFVKTNSNEKQFAINIARTLSFGIGILNESWLEAEDKIGPEKGSTTNLMDTTGNTDLTYFQWINLRNSSKSYSFFDNDENIKTNNGTVAYYFWEEDKNGNIILNDDFLNSIKRPYKKNFLSYRFEVKYKILKPFYKIYSYYISSVNIFILLIVIVLILLVRKWIKKFWLKKSYKSRFWRRILYLPILAGILYLTYESFEISNLILDKFKVISGPLLELENLDYKKSKKELLINSNLRHQEEGIICSEVLIKQNKKWNLKKRMKVLYFELQENQKTKSWDKIKLVSNSDSLKLKTINYFEKAKTHFMVFSYLNKNGEVEKQEVINYLGLNLTEKLELSQKADTLLNETNPAKRILVFVNGYRPTSIGHTFEENFNDIKNKGLEFPNSKNYIYDFDRYDYWTPWNNINLLFQKRINPNETYYADGHFSVGTSNYRSIMTFTQVSQQYPKRCANKNKHHCYKKTTNSLKESIFSNSKTIDDLKMRANKKGFNLRKSKGRLAARNLLQILNEIPKSSENDTLYLIAHSMGFAYAQGMIEELKGKINFGSYYIIAPENAKSGKVNESEWQEVWQYGSRFNTTKFDAPCLQDGVAPQTKASGLSDSKRIYIPSKLYSKRGFFDSHFIGYYSWILDISQGKKGSVRQM
ncbi:MAG: hypothetical protein V4622_11190 [Bacteroidota bacterium]